MLTNFNQLVLSGGRVTKYVFEFNIPHIFLCNKDVNKENVFFLLYQPQQYEQNNNTDTNDSQKRKTQNFDSKFQNKKIACSGEQKHSEHEESHVKLKRDEIVQKSLGKLIADYSQHSSNKRKLQDADNRRIQDPYFNTNDNLDKFNYSILSPSLKNKKKNNINDNSYNFIDSYFDQLCLSSSSSSSLNSQFSPQIHQEPSISNRLSLKNKEEHLKDFEKANETNCASMQFNISLETQAPSQQQYTPFKPVNSEEKEKYLNNEKQKSALNPDSAIFTPFKSEKKKESIDENEKRTNCSSSCVGVHSTVGKKTMMKISSPEFIPQKHKTKTQPFKHLHYTTTSSSSKSNSRFPENKNECIKNPSFPICLDFTETESVKAKGNKNKPSSNPQIPIISAYSTDPSENNNLNSPQLTQPPNSVLTQAGALEAARGLHEDLRNKTFSTDDLNYAEPHWKRVAETEMRTQNDSHAAEHMSMNQFTTLTASPYPQNTNTLTNSHFNMPPFGKQINIHDHFTNAQPLLPPQSNYTSLQSIPFLLPFQNNPNTNSNINNIECNPLNLTHDRIIPHNLFPNFEEPQNQNKLFHKLPDMGCEGNLFKSEAFFSERRNISNNNTYANNFNNNTSNNSNFNNSLNNNNAGPWRNPQNKKNDYCMKNGSQNNNQRNKIFKRNHCENNKQNEFKNAGEADQLAGSENQAQCKLISLALFRMLLPQEPSPPCLHSNFQNFLIASTPQIHSLVYLI